MTQPHSLPRRQWLTQGAAILGTASTGLLLPQSALAQSGKIRVGLMLPYTGTFAQLGIAIEKIQPIAEEVLRQYQMRALVLSIAGFALA